MRPVLARPSWNGTVTIIEMSSVRGRVSASRCQSARRLGLRTVTVRNGPDLGLGLLRKDSKRWPLRDARELNQTCPDKNDDVVMLRKEVRRKCTSIIDASSA